MATRTDKPEKQDEGARSFAVLLQAIGEGTFHAECSEQLHELTRRLEAHAYDFSKAKGTLTLALTVEIDREGVVTIDPDLKLKVPKPARKKGRFWVTPGGNLSPENPKQTTLPLREVPAARAPRDMGPEEAKPVHGV